MQLDLNMLGRYTKLANYRAKASNTNAANQLKTILERHICGHRVYKNLSSDSIETHFQKLIENGAIDFPNLEADCGRVRFEHVDSYFTDHVELVLMDSKVAVFFVDYQSNTIGATVVDVSWLIPFMAYHKLDRYARQQALLNQVTSGRPAPVL